LVTKKSESSFFSIAPILTKDQCVLEGSQILILCPFSKRWIWSIGRIIRTGEIEVLGEKLISVPLCPPQILLGLA